VSVYETKPTIDWVRMARRILLATALLTAVLVLIGMALSYAGLRSAYRGAGFPEWAAAAAPLCVDLLTVVAYVGLIVLAGKAYPAALVAFGIGASAFAQGFHGSHGGVDAAITNWLVVALLYASPIIFAGLGGHLFFKVVERSTPADFITALRGESHPGGSFAAPTTDERAGTVEVQLEALDERDRRLLHAATWDEDMTDLDAELEASMAAHPAGNGQVNPPRMRGSREGEPPGIYLDRMPARPQVATTAERAPSQKRGPCSARCGHHVGEKVSKSTRYRCQAGLDGKPNGCPDCAKAREVGHA
jgi:hypothetical protein